MKFLIAGLGSIGRRHLRNLLALGHNDIVLYRTHRSTLPEEDLADFPVETNLDSALEHAPDAVIVSNPTALHLNVAIPAAEAGCHLLIEKPISHSMDGIAGLQAAVAKTGVRVLVGYHFRYHPGLQRIAELLGQAAIGRPVSARAHWGEYLPDWHPWEDYSKGYSARPDLGGGVVLTLSHPFDYLRWLLGDIAALSAFVGALGDLDIQVEDTAEINLRFAGGALGSLHLDYLQQPPSHTLEIIGTHGAIRWDNSDGIVHLYQPDAGGWQFFSPPKGLDRNQLFLNEMQHFIDVAAGKAEPACTLADGIAALELALAALRSSQEGRQIEFAHAEVAK
jgi:predicted dehydrogenase